MNDGLNGNNNFNYYNNNYSDNPNLERKNRKSVKTLFVIFGMLISMILIMKIFTERKTQDQLYAELTDRICIAAETYIANNPTILDKTQPGKSTIIKFRTLSDANLVEVQIENPYYEGTFLRKSTQPKYYSMDNSVRLVVLNDGTFGCELVDNANDETPPKLRLNGDSEIVLVVGTEYEDPGYAATDDYDGDVTDKVSMSGNVNSAEAGEYEIAFTVQDSAGNVSTEKRKVIYENYSNIEVTLGSVTDSAIPQISLKGANPYCMVKGTKYEEPGAIAIDNVDGNITDRIAVTNKITGNVMGAFRVVYKVEDSSGNQAVAYRSVIVSASCSEKEEAKKIVNTRPVISLIGKNSVTINKGTEYIDLGTNAYDKEDGNITNMIVTDTTGINTNSPGIYKVIYRVTDSGGLTATTTRTVTVKEQTYSNPVVRFTEEKTNINILVGEGNDALLVAPKAVNENNRVVNVVKKIEDYVTKKTVNSIDWSKAGKYRVIYTAIHGSGILKQTKNVIVTIKNNIVKISGSDAISISKRSENKDITEADLIRGGVVFETKSKSNPIITLKNYEGKASIVGEHNIKVEAKIDDGPITSKEITVYVIDNSQNEETTKPEEKPTVTPNEPIIPSFPKEPEDVAPVEPGKVKITGNTANPNNVYNTNNIWVGGAVTGISISFEVEPKAAVEIAHFEWSTDCKNVDGTISKTISEMTGTNGYESKDNNSGSLTWNNEGSTSVCIRAVSRENVKGLWSDPVKFLIDRTGPRVEFTHTWADEKEDWHNTPSLKLEYKASDEEAGLSHFEYTYDDVKAKKADEIVTYNEATGNLIVYENIEPTRKELFVYVRAVDKVGNKGEWTLNPAFINIDTVKPNSPTLTVVGNETSVVKINATFKDGESVRPSGFGKLIYTIDDGAELVETSKTITMPSNASKTISNNSVKVWAVDKAGNKSDNFTTQAVQVLPANILATGVELSNDGNKIANGESCSLYEINPGATFALSAIPIPSNADQKDVVWDVTNENIAEIDEKGNVTTKRAGTVTITAKIGDVSTSCNLTIESQVYMVSRPIVCSLANCTKCSSNNICSKCKTGYQLASDKKTCVKVPTCTEKGAYSTKEECNKASINKYGDRYNGCFVSNKCYYISDPKPETSGKTVSTKDLSGSDRYNTSVLVSKEIYPNGSNNVVLVRGDGDNLSDGYISSSLASALNAPILLVRNSKIDNSVLNEISRLKPKKIYIVGGSTVISNTLEQTIKNKYKVIIERIYGNDVYLTATSIANKVNSIKKINSVIIAPKDNEFVDAALVTYVSGKENIPILYSKTNLLTEATEKFLKSNKNINKVYLIGGGFNSSVSSKIKSLGKNVEIIAGKDRYETNSLIINKFDKKFNSVVLVNNFTDIVAASQLASKKDSVLIYSKSKLNESQLKLISNNIVSNVYTLGGESIKPILRDLINNINNSGSVEPTKVELNKTEATLKVGKTLKLEYVVSPSNADDKTVTWSSSDESVVTVNNGNVTALKEGSATITVKTSNGKEHKCKIIVSSPTNTTEMCEYIRLNNKTKVTYDDFKKVVNNPDDYYAIKAAHDCANQLNLPVSAASNGIYNIYKKNSNDSPIVVKTSTDLNNATIYIHDENNVIGTSEDREAIFSIENPEKTIKLDNSKVSLLKGNIKRNVKKINALAGYGNILVEVVNDNKKQFVRVGVNENQGDSQTEVFKVDNNGNVLNDIIWNYDDITKVNISKIPNTALTFKNGKFVTIASTESGVNSRTNYAFRGIVVKRNNTVLNNIDHTVVNTNKVKLDSIPYTYFGFIQMSFVSDVSISNSNLYALKTTKVSPNSTYDFIIEKATNLTINNVKIPENQLSGSYWGVVATNYVKDITFNNCRLNRIDSHKGANNLTISNTVIGDRGLTLIGGGKLKISNTTVSGTSQFITLRSDYGSLWDGSIEITNSTFKPNTTTPSLISMQVLFDNNLIHNFGYDLVIPNVTVTNFTIQKPVTNFAIYDNSKTGLLNGNLSLANNYTGGRFKFTAPSSIKYSNIVSSSGNIIVSNYKKAF